jgi:hypothetical protein
MSFKFFRGLEKELVDISEMGYPAPILTLRPQTFQRDNVEFCFQFDDGEPTVFGVGPNDLHIHVAPTPNGNITFTNNNGQTFKIFAREIIGGNVA